MRQKHRSLITVCALRWGWVGLGLATLWFAPLEGIARAADRARQIHTGEPLVAWPYFQEILLPELPASSDSTWSDLVLSPGVFDKARIDLADLRLYDQDDHEVPYALRIRRAENRRDAVQASVFNRARGPEDSTELSLDLSSGAVEHNEVEVQMPGVDFRRRAMLEGSDDRDQWRELTVEHLVRFQAEKGLFQDVSLTYPPSRFRYLRLRVYRDPVIDKAPTEIKGVSVYRTIEVAGEMVTRPGSLEQRVPTRLDGAPASAWTMGLGGENMPVEEIAVIIADEDFVRDYVIEAGGPEGSPESFRRIHAGTWRRRAGEEMKALRAEFSEVRAARLRLVVVDHGNPPLDVRSVEFSAAARQVVFTRQEAAGARYRLYYGNVEAGAPFYDFARNLPEALAPAPIRAQLGEPQPNPVYAPEPLPLTERWPWLIYAVLGAVSLVLGAVIVRVARRAIAVHDRPDLAFKVEAE